MDTAIKRRRLNPTARTNHIGFPGGQRIINPAGAGRLELNPADEEHFTAVRDWIRGIAAERRAVQYRIRIRKIVVVPQIDEIRPELKLHLFPKRERFHQTEIPILKSGTSKSIPPQGAAARHGICQEAGRKRDQAGAIQGDGKCSQIVGHGILDQDSTRVCIRSR